MPPSSSYGARGRTSIASGPMPPPSSDLNSTLSLQPSGRVGVLPLVGLAILEACGSGRTSESNAGRMAAALEPRHGPLTVVPA
jgi:hypothetical protein